MSNENEAGKRPAGQSDSEGGPAALERRRRLLERLGRGAYLAPVTVAMMSAKALAAS